MSIVPLWHKFVGRDIETHRQRDRQAIVLFWPAAEAGSRLPSVQEERVEGGAMGNEPQFYPSLVRPTPAAELWGLLTGESMFPRHRSPRCRLRVVADCYRWTG